MALLVMGARDVALRDDDEEDEQPRRSGLASSRAHFFGQVCWREKRDGRRESGAGEAYVPAALVARCEMRLRVMSDGCGQLWR